MPDDIKLPEPHCYIYEWDSHFGTNRSTNRSRWNGRKPDRSFPLYTADQVRAAVEADRAERKPLTDEQIVACLIESDCVGTVKMSYDVGPYEITKLSVNAKQLTRAIEAAHGIPAPKGGAS